MDLVAYNVNCFAKVEGFEVNIPFLGKKQIEFGLPLVGVSWDFALNTVPTATCQIGVGKDARTGTPSTIHALAEHLTTRRRIKIIASLTRIDKVPGFTLGIPSGQQFTIFDGFTGMGGFSRSIASANFQINVEHWLSDLDFASIFSQSSHPANPAQYSYGALMGEKDPTGIAAWTNLSQAQDYIDINALQGDFWTDGLKKWLLHLCERDLFQLWEPRYLAREGKGNDLAKAAIERIVVHPEAPLKFDISADNQVVSAISEAISDMTQNPDALASQTILDLLIGQFAKEFLFGLVPRIDNAYVAPYVPGYREPYKTIVLDENSSFDWTRAANRPLAGVGVMALLGTEAGGEQTKDVGQDLKSIGIGGFYPLEDEKSADNGMVMIMEAPKWANSMMSFVGSADLSAGGGGAPIPSVLDPKPPGDKAKELAEKVKEAKERNQKTVKPFFDRYAKALYAMMVTRGRQAAVAGPLRFDIAPGTTVKINAPATSANDKLGISFYGTVVRVSGNLNAEPAQAGTSFHLANIRTSVEQEGEDADATSVEKHPLYTETFKGTGLTDFP